MQALEAALCRAGYDGCISELLLFPGKQRQEAICWATSRLLGGGRSIAQVWPLISAAAGGRGGDDVGSGDQMLSEEERLAKRCQQVLAILGIKTSMDDIRGCSKGRSDLLIQLAEIVRAVESQRAAGSLLAGSDSAVHGPLSARKLLDAACDLGGRLWSDAVQLFPRDLSLVVEEYRGAAEQLPSLAPMLHQKLAGQAAASSCDSDKAQPTMDVWTGGMESAAHALKEMMHAGSQLTGVFEQELSVWSEDTEPSFNKGQAQPQHQCAQQLDGLQQQQEQQQQQQPCRQGNEGAQGLSIPELGRAAHTVLDGYQDISCLMEALGLLMDMHATLQDVPRDWLADLTTSQAQAAAGLSDGAALLRRV